MEQEAAAVQTIEIPKTARRPLARKLPWWILILLAAGVLMVYSILTSANYRQTFDYMSVGVLVTLRMTVIGFPIATTIGLIVGLMRTSKNTALFNLGTLYVETVRGIPLIVIILYFAFGLVPTFRTTFNNIGNWGLAWGRESLLGGFFYDLANFDIRSIPMESRAIIALAIGYGAFEAEIFRAGIESIGKGQMEAARSLGMTYMQSMRYIILPQAIRRVLPPLGNDFIALLKDSSLATVLAVPELTQLSRLQKASTFRYMEVYNVLAFLYLSMTLLLSAGVKGLEKKLRYEEK